MKNEEALQLAFDKPDFLCESGSHLYGMTTPISDYDLRGFIFPPFSYLIGIKSFNAAEIELKSFNALPIDGDKKLYSAGHFLKLVLRGDPQTSELFFAQNKHIVTISELGKEILALKDSLISNAIFGRIMGYSTGEWRKAMAIKLVPTKWKKEKHEVINDIRNLWEPDKKAMDNIITGLENLDEMKVISSQAGLGVKRKADIEKYGFCRKSAAHSIRLVQQVTELMETGNMTFPRPNAKMLLAIRNGEYTKEELQEIHDETVAKAEEMRPKSILRDKPDQNKVWEKYEKIIAKVIQKDSRFLELI